MIHDFFQKNKSMAYFLKIFSEGPVCLAPIEGDFLV